MEQQLMELLDSSLVSTDCKIKASQIILAVQAGKEMVYCPYCGCPSKKIHSTYVREIQDIPFQDKQTILLLTVIKMFCDNPECTFKTFSEPIVDKLSVGRVCVDDSAFRKRYTYGTVMVDLDTRVCEEKSVKADLL